MEVALFSTRVLPEIRALYGHLHKSQRAETLHSVNQTASRDKYGHGYMHADMAAKRWNESN